MIENFIGLAPWIAGGAAVAVGTMGLAVAQAEGEHQRRIDIARRRRLRNQEPYQVSIDLIAEQRMRESEAAGGSQQSQQQPTMAPLTSAGALAEWFARCVVATTDPNDVVSEADLVNNYRVYCLKNSLPEFSPDQANGFMALLETHMQIIGRPIQDDGYGGGRSIGIKLQG
jgi:hypothetical protein